MRIPAGADTRDVASPYLDEEERIMSNQPPERRRYLFLLSEPGEKAIEFADNYLHELGVRVTTVFGTGALAGLATPQHV